MASILIVEDEPNLSNQIRGNLVDDGYRVEQVIDGTSALEAVEAEVPALILLDIMLPGVDGLEVCRQLRQTSIVTILMLTARGEEIDLVLGLEVGADDYLTNSFSMCDLQAWVRAILRWVEMMLSKDAAKGEVLKVAGLRLDMDGYGAAYNGELFELTPKEFVMLYLLASHPGRLSTGWRSNWGKRWQQLGPRKKRSKRCLETAGSW